VWTSPHALVWWAVLAALLVVLAMTGAQLLRALRELERAGDRAAAFADLPVLRKLQRAEDDVRRIEAAVDAVPGLVARAQAAVAAIRRGPIPPELPAAIRSVRAEIAAFKRFARR
jgi:hypothetical protein